MSMTLYTWYDFADSYLREFTVVERIKRSSIPSTNKEDWYNLLYDCFPILKSVKHHICYCFQFNMGGLNDYEQRLKYTFIVEFDNSNKRGFPKNNFNIIHENFAKVILPRLKGKKWRQGEVFYNDNGLVEWVRNNLVSPTTIITTEDFLLVVSDDPEDITLLKVRATAVDPRVCHSLFEVL